MIDAFCNRNFAKMRSRQALRKDLGSGRRGLGRAGKRLSRPGGGAARHAQAGRHVRRRHGLERIGAPVSRSLLRDEAGKGKFAKASFPPQDHRGAPRQVPQPKPDSSCRTAITTIARMDNIGLADHMAGMVEWIQSNQRGDILLSMWEGIQSEIEERTETGEKPETRSRLCGLLGSGGQAGQRGR
jgi:hypothetical protein